MDTYRYFLWSWTQNNENIYWINIRQKVKQGYELYVNQQYFTKSKKTLPIYDIDGKLLSKKWTNYKAIAVQCDQPMHQNFGTAQTWKYSFRQKEVSHYSQHFGKCSRLNDWQWRWRSNGYKQRIIVTSVVHE